jgi:diguanylate cyclase (GGDEF)-like protein
MGEQTNNHGGLTSIKVGIDDNYPPYSFHNEQGELQGISIDQWKLWEKKTGIKVYLYGMNWDRCQHLMQEGAFDVIDTMFYNKERARLYEFTKPYTRIDVPIFFHKSISGIYNVDSLQGFSVAVKKGDNGINILKEKGITNLEQFDSYEDIIQAAKDNKIRIFVVDKPPAFYFMYKMQIQDEFNYSKPLYSGEFHRAVRKGNLDLLATVEDGFAQISDREYKAIDTKWLGSSIFNPVWIRYVGLIVTGILLIIITMLLWNYTLQKKVKEKTAGMYDISIHDHLTGLYNRGYFENNFEGLACKNNLPLGLVMCDLDGLKIINDTFGHAMGDFYLITIARLLLESFRQKDVAARIGGDEFAIIMTNTTEGEIKENILRLNRKIEWFNQQQTVSIPLSVSCGYAFRESCSAGETDKMIKEAEHYMYREKLHHRQSIKSEMVQSMISLLKARDYITEGHAERMQDMASRLALAAGVREGDISDIRLLAQFHDIGKVGIPDHVLHKPGILNEDEMREMRRHPEIGSIIAEASIDLMPIADGILKHHEWWDGNGYPMGLKGENIPVACRIIAIVDAYDVMVNDRPYRKAMSKSEAIKELKKFAGSQFDPHLVALFIELLDDVAGE